MRLARKGEVKVGSIVLLVVMIVSPLNLVGFGHIHDPENEVGKIGFVGDFHFHFFRQRNSRHEAEHCSVVGRIIVVLRKLINQSETLCCPLVCLNE